MKEDQVIYLTDVAEFPSKKQLWQRKQMKRKTISVETPIITVSHSDK